MLNSRNQSHGNLQKKLTQLQHEHNELKEKFAALTEKQNSLLAKRNNHFSCSAKEKQLKERLASTERELMTLNEKYEENRVKLQGLEIRQEATTAENRRLKKLLEEKERTFVELREKCDRLEGDLHHDERDRKEMLDSLFDMINGKQSELQQKHDELDRCDRLMSGMVQQIEQLTLQNRQLEQLNSRFVAIDPTAKLHFTELKQLAERLSERSLSDQLLSRLLRVE